MKICQKNITKMKVHKEDCKKNEGEGTSQHPGEAKKAESGDSQKA